MGYLVISFFINILLLGFVLKLDLEKKDLLRLIELKKEAGRW